MGVNLHDKRLENTVIVKINNQHSYNHSILTIVAYLITN